MTSSTRTDRQTEVTLWGLQSFKLLPVIWAVQHDLQDYISRRFFPFFKTLTFDRFRAFFRVIYVCGQATGYTLWPSNPIFWTYDFQNNIPEVFFFRFSKLWCLTALGLFFGYFWAYVNLGQRLLSPERSSAARHCAGKLINLTSGFSVFHHRDRSNTLLHLKIKKFPVWSLIFENFSFFLLLAHFC